MNPADQLLAYACGQVTPEQIARFTPGDPGYAAYVQRLTAVWEMKRVPERRRNLFDLTEPIALTNYWDAKRPEDVVPLSRFRIFTNAIALVLLCGGLPSDTVHPPNYVLYRLLDDAAIVDDPELTRLLPPACMQLHERLEAGTEEEEYPFALLAFILASLAAGVDPSQLQPAATRLMEEERLARQMAAIDGDLFFLGTTEFFDRFHSDWQRLVLTRIPAQGVPEDLLLVREAMGVR